MKIETNKNITTIQADGIQISLPSADLFRHFNQAFLADMLSTILERIGIDREKASQYAQNPEFTESWLEAVANDETIRVCMDQLAAKCVETENRIINGFNEANDSAATASAPHDFVKNLAQYDGGALNGHQLRELCSYFTVMADPTILLSPSFRVNFNTCVLPKLQDENFPLCIEGKTVDHISKLATGVTPLDCAIQAKEFLLRLHNANQSRTVNADVHPRNSNVLMTAEDSLANFIHQHKDHTVCLFTNSKYLVNHMLPSEYAPKCICVGLNDNNEFFIHQASINRLMDLCWPAKAGGNA